MKDCWLRGMVPAGADRILAVFGVNLPERTSMLFLLPLQAPR